MAPHLVITMTGTDCVPPLMTRLQLLAQAAMQPESLTVEQSVSVLAEFRALKQLVS